AGVEGQHALLGVVGDGAVDVDGVDVRVFQQLGVIGVALGDLELVAGRVELLPVAPADGGHLGVGVGLKDGDELRPKPQSDDGDANLLAHLGSSSSSFCLGVRAAAGRRLID